MKKEKIRTITINVYKSRYGISTGISVEPETKIYEVINDLISGGTSLLIERGYPKKEAEDYINNFLTKTIFTNKGKRK